METFGKVELPKIVKAISDTATSCDYHGIDEIDWDVNIIAGGKGISKISKRVAMFKIKPTCE